MRPFDWCEVDKAQKAREPEPKGLELVINESPIDVKYDGKYIGHVNKNKFHPNSY